MALFAAVALILISGCAQQQGGSNDANAVGAKPTAGKDISQMTDEEIIAKAAADKNTSLCEMVGDMFKKPNCYDAVWKSMDKGIPEKALAARDPSLCKPLSSNTARDACVTTIAVAEFDEKICEKIGDDKAYQEGRPGPEYGKKQITACKNEVFKSSALAKGDASLCKKIETEGMSELYQDSCIRDVARENKDYSACSLLSKKEGILGVDGCYYEAAILALDKAICGKISNKDIKTQCTAVATKDVSLCGSLPKEASSSETFEFTKNDCYAEIAKKYSDEKVCKEISTGSIYEESDQVNCFRTVAIAKGDVSICNNISSQQFREGCVQWYNLEMCNKIESLEGRDDCKESLFGRNQSAEDKEIYSNAMSKEDIAECGKISDAGYRQKCKDQLHFNKAITERDAAECDLMSDSSSGKGSCYLFLVIGVGPHHGDKSLCEKIPDREDAAKKLCMEP